MRHSQPPKLVCREKVKCKEKSLTRRVSPAKTEVTDQLTFDGPAQYRQFFFFLVFIEVVSYSNINVRLCVIMYDKINFAEIC